MAGEGQSAGIDGRIGKGAGRPGEEYGWVEEADGLVCRAGLMSCYAGVDLLETKSRASGHRRMFLARLLVEREELDCWTEQGRSREDPIR
jgi:hypothetical protein